MKIGIITAESITSGYGNRILSEIEQLDKCNIDFAVISFLHVRYWKNIRGIWSYFRQIQRLEHNVYIIPEFPQNQNEILHAALDIYRFFCLKIFIKHEKPTILHCQSTQSAYLGVALKKFTGLPVVYDMHGASVAEIQAVYGLDAPIVKRTEEMEKKAILNSDVIISVSTALNRYWKQKYPIALASSYIIPCVVDDNKIKYDSLSRRIKRDQWGITDDVPVFVYLGSLAFYQKIDVVLRVFSNIKSHFPRSKILILTSENNFPTIKSLANKFEINDNLMLFSVAHNDVSGYLSACDIGYLLRDDMLLNNVSSPTKFGEYLACGVPVITSASIFDIKSALAEYNVGMLFSEDMSKVITFIQDVMRNRQAWIDRCVGFVDLNYSWKVYASKLMTIYNELTLKR